MTSSDHAHQPANAIQPRSDTPRLGGVVHSYQKYDPREFPSPTAPPPDLAGAAMDFALSFGDASELTEEQLARAIRLDPSMFPRLGPSLASLRAMLEERKRRILATYETSASLRDAAEAFRERAAGVVPPKELRQAFDKAIRSEQVRDLERLYYNARDDRSAFSKALVALINALGQKYQVEELASKRAFTGREPMSVPKALATKEELDAIDKLLDQLKEAEQNAQLAIIDLEQLSEFADMEGENERIEELNRVQQQIEDYIRDQAARQGLDRDGRGFRLTPKAMRMFQKQLLTEIFSDLAAGRSGRHDVGVLGAGAVEIERTRDYQFGDPPASMDIVQTLLNAAARQAAEASPVPASPTSAPLRPRSTDLSIHLTRNNPKCATTVIMDMSGSMRYDSQYVHCKRMALALDALIRTEYPGDHLSFVEMYSIAKLRSAGEIVSLLPKPVSISAPRVRLKADMSNPRISEMQLPQHFTNIQHALRLARQVLAAQDTPNRQAIVITDGLPTAHFDGSDLFFLYPPDPLTEHATMREAALCRAAGITINIFLLPNWSQSEEDVRFAHRLAEETQGRVFFTGGRDLERCVVWDYVKHRRRVLG
jgi:uncharacterized protein with von Willebrand factor type A (vWA) domain